jgi:hypothetical protein
MPLLQGLRPYVSPDLTLKSSRLFTLWYSNVAVKSHEISINGYVHGNIIYLGKL